MMETEKLTKEEIKEKEKERKIKIKEKAKAATEKFQREFRKSVTESIIAAFGLLIALTWKDVISAWVNKLSEASPIKGSLISAIIVTAICVFGILIISKWGKEKDKKEAEK